ncbi:MAG: YjbQ family protein [Candidatus Magnetomorum sp.]|nr:YjbQ family protein [Candidatus Magnetomorum sp.]
MKCQTINIQTQSKTELIDITNHVQTFVRENKIEHGICMIYIPHTTAAVTINENADPTVKQDVLMVLNDIIPWKANYKHLEGNSPAHIKSIICGASELIPVADHQLVLGTWQGIFFCEFDGPRNRKFYIQMLSCQ